MLDIVNAAKILGFKALGATGEYEDLAKEKMPVIAHVIIDNILNHFIVIYKIKPEKIYVADPGKRKYWLSKSEFIKIWRTKSVIILSPQNELLKVKTPSWYKWIFEYIKKEESWVTQSLFLGFVYTVLGLATAMFVQLLLDKFIPQKDITKIFYGGVFLIAIFLIKSIAGYLRQRFLVILNKNVNTNINADFLAHLFKLPKKFFDTRKIGEITARINDAIRIQRAVLQIIGTTIIDALIIIGSFALMFYFSATLAFLSITLIPIYALVLFASIKKLKSQQNEVMKGYAIVEAAYIDSLKSIDEIIGFNVGNSFFLKNKFLFSEYQEKVKTLGFTQAFLSFIAEILGGIIVVILLVTGAIRTAQGDLMLGKMIAAYSLLANILPAVNRFVDANIVLQETSIASTRLMDMLLVNKEKSKGKEGFRLEKKLSIINGSFSWDGRKYLFENINLDLKKGKITSLWGGSGVGKSTIAQILQRKYKLNKGGVFVDEINVEKINLSDYRKNVATVPQTIKIFNGSIVENILVGREIPSYGYLEKRIYELGLSPFYQRFEFGFATIIGEEGRELSGGEKQLISITRALLFYPQVLIIDEGLSGIDIELEKIIFEVLKNYAKENVVLLITHNMNSIMKSDFVYVLANGTFIQKGEPEKLISEEGYFKNMWELKNKIYGKQKVVINA